MIGWLESHSAFLKELVEQGSQSFAEIARSINAKFGTVYTRNACIGRSKRKGFVSPNSNMLTGAVDWEIERFGRSCLHRRAARAEQTKVKFTAKTKMIGGNVIDLRSAPVEPMHIGIADLTSNNCHYPYGDDHITFCGHPHLDGFPYCAPHVALTTKVRL